VTLLSMTASSYSFWVPGVRLGVSLQHCKSGIIT
jgi:hypothetical protein